MVGRERREGTSLNDVSIRLPATVSTIARVRRKQGELAVTVGGVPFTIKPAVSAPPEAKPPAR